MYKRPRPSRTTIQQNDSVEGEMLESKVERVVNNGEPIKEGSQTYYTDRKEGVIADFNPRTDKWDIALEGMDKVTKSRLAKRAEILAENEPKKPETGVNGGTSQQQD